MTKYSLCLCLVSSYPGGAFTCLGGRPSRMSVVSVWSNGSARPFLLIVGQRTDPFFRYVSDVRSVLAVLRVTKVIVNIFVRVIVLIVQSVVLICLSWSKCSTAFKKFKGI